MKKELLLITFFFFFVNVTFAQLPKDGDWKTRMGIISPKKAKNLYEKVFAKESPIIDTSNTDGINLKFYIEEFKPLMDLAPYCDYVYYGGYLFQEQTDRAGNTSLSFYQRLLNKIDDLAIRMIIVEDLLGLGLRFVNDLDSINAVRNNYYASIGLKKDPLSLAVAMTKYAHLYYKYAGDSKYYPAHLYDKAQACENFRSAFRVLRDNNVNLGDELEAFYVNEYYKACEHLYRSDEQKYYETFLQDYLEIVKTCDNLLLPYYHIPDSIKNNESDSSYSAYRNYNYYTNHKEEGIKNLFKQSGAASPERMNSYFMSKLNMYRNDEAYLERALFLLNENGCVQTDAFYSYSEASYAIKPTYLNCIGCAFASKKYNLLTEMYDFYRQAVDLASDSLRMGIAYNLIAREIQPTRRPKDSNNKDYVTSSQEFVDWKTDMETGVNYYIKVLDFTDALSNSTSIDERNIPVQAAMTLGNLKYWLAHGNVSPTECQEAIDYYNLALKINPEIEIESAVDRVKKLEIDINNALLKRKTKIAPGYSKREIESYLSSLKSLYKKACEEVHMSGKNANRETLREYESYYKSCINIVDNAAKSDYESYKKLKKNNGL